MADAPKRTASLTPDYAVGPDGRLYRRGYRMHCPACGALGKRGSYSAVSNQVTAHKCKESP